MNSGVGKWRSFGFFPVRGPVFPRLYDQKRVSLAIMGQ